MYTLISRSGFACPWTATTDQRPVGRGCVVPSPRAHIIIISELLGKPAGTLRSSVSFCVLDEVMDWWKCRDKAKINTVNYGARTSLKSLRTGSRVDPTSFWGKHEENASTLISYCMQQCFSRKKKKLIALVFKCSKMHFDMENWKPVRFVTHATTSLMHHSYRTLARRRQGRAWSLALSRRSRLDSALLCIFFRCLAPFIHVYIS